MLTSLTAIEHGTRECEQISTEVDRWLIERKKSKPEIPQPDLSIQEKKWSRLQTLTQSLLRNPFLCDRAKDNLRTDLNTTKTKFEVHVHTIT